MRRVALLNRSSRKKMPGFKIGFLGLAVLPLAQFSPTVCVAMEAGIFEPPQYISELELAFEGEVFSFANTWMADLDDPKDGHRESVLVKFAAPNGKVLLQFVSQGGFTWGWGVFGNLEDRSDDTRNFVILDSDGDGLSDRKYGANEDVPKPAWFDNE